MHTTTHSPIAHISVGRQLWPQVPQCAMSVLTSVQIPSHPRRGAMQLQRPIAQLVPTGHAFPQLPQFIESSETRVQVPEQSTKPGMHMLLESGRTNPSGIDTCPSIGWGPESWVGERATVQAVIVITSATAIEARQEA